MYLCEKCTGMFEDFRLKVFMTVAREKSFTKAASELGVSQPAVSQNVSELEKSAGVKLFDRLRGEVVLTPQGRIFMEYVQKIIATCSGATHLFAKVPSSTIRISASEEIFSIYLAPALEKYMTVHPEVLFERTIFDDADVAVVLQPSSESPFEIPDESIARIRISISPAPKMGDYRATHEKSSYFDLLWKPSPAFACTQICRQLKDFITSF